MGGGTAKRITVAYFAMLREQRGLERETVETVADTPEALWEELREAHGLGLSRAMLMAAINGEFGAWDTLLEDGDEVVFLPPVAGG